MIVTAKRIPVPDPIAPTKSANIVSAPMHSPPRVAAVGITLRINKFIILFESVSHIGISGSGDEISLVF